MTAEEIRAQARRLEASAAELNRMAQAITANPVLQVAVALHRVLSCKWCDVDGGGGGSTHYEPARIPGSTMDGWEIAARRVNESYEEAARRLLKMHDAKTLVDVLSALTVVITVRP